MQSDSLFPSEWSQADSIDLILVHFYFFLCPLWVKYNNTCLYIKPATQHLLEYLFILMQYIFNSIDEQAARIIHTTAKSTAIVVDEIAQSAE